MLELRDYQIDALEGIRSKFIQGHRRVMLSLPTGAGKTIVGSAFIAAAREKDSNVIFVADRIALVQQTSEKLYEYGIRHGVAQGSSTFGRFEPVQVCSAQTLEKRGYWNDADLVIVDEAHIFRKKIVQFLEATDVRTIGLSATPLTQGLGDIYTAIVNPVTTDELTEQGWLVPLKVYCATEVDMTGAPVNAGEWSGAEASRRVVPIVGDIVSDWVRHTTNMFGMPVKTLVFSASVDDGAELCRQFQAAGYHFEQVSYKDRDDDERKAKIRAFREGRTIGLISVDALGRGFDVPDALCLISARPYRSSLAAHIQQLGRIMRPSPGKSFALVLDHVGNFLRFADATEAFWAAGCSSMRPKAQEKLKKKIEFKPTDERKCLGCGLVLPVGVTMCPSCGLEKQRKSKLRQYVPGKMKEYVSLRKQVGGDLWPHVCAHALYRYGEANSKALKFAKVQYKELTGRWPNWGREFEPGKKCDPRVAEAIERKLKNWRQRQRKNEKKAEAVPSA